MPSPPILILADAPDLGRLVSGGPADDAEGDPPLRALSWSDLGAGIPGTPSPAGIVCEMGESLRARAGLVSLLRRAWPDAPVLGFLPAGEPARDLPGLPDLGLPVEAPVTAANLRMLVRREARLLTLARRHRAAVAHLRDQSEKLDLLVDTVRSASTRRDPGEVSALLLGRLAELLGADSWRLSLLREESETARVETLRGGRGRKLESSDEPADEAAIASLGAARQPTLLPEGSPVTGTSLALPLVSRGRTIGLAELFTAENDAEARFGARELELARALAEPLAILVDNALEFRRLEEQSVTDELTGLANSRFLKACLGREIKRARRYGSPLSVIFIDLDGFKTVNDAHGHLAGSRMLAELGRVLRESMRETDIVARYGGDEFTIVMTHAGQDDAKLTCSRLRQRIEDRVFLESEGIRARITASFGIACYPEHGDTREGLIAAADRAMYRVKEQGKNGVQTADPAVPAHCV